MPQYLSPGVYVEEVSAGGGPIAGVSTSIGGFIGQVADNVTMPDQPGVFQMAQAMDDNDPPVPVVDGNGQPVMEQVLDDEGNPIPVPFTVAAAGQAQLITGWERFKKQFGDFQAGNKTLAHAVFGFFNNGGSRCWITRLSAAINGTNVAPPLTGFEAIDEITMVAVPGATDVAVQSAIIDHCEKTGDRFAILDGQITNTLTPAGIQSTLRNSNYAALYYPRISVYDPVTSGNDFVTPTGHMAGIYARVDSERGVHKAPANEVIRGALGVERRLSKADHDGLNPAGINVIRQFNGNITPWGARTLGGDANGEWKYINVRRLFLFLRESIDEGTQWVVFEPNAPDLWAKITRNVTAFLTNVWRSGALFGNTASEAFFVRCDEETNPPEVRDLGQVVTEIGVAVVKPAEFVIFRISQWSGPGG